MDKVEFKPIPQMNQSIIDFLISLPIFDKLSSEELHVVGKFMYYVKAKHGKIIFKEGDKGSYIFFLASGVVDVLKYSESGHYVSIATLSKGRSIGEMAVIDNYTRSATIRTRDNVMLLMIEKTEFNKLLEKYPAIGVKILLGITRLLSQGLRKTSSRLVDYMLPLG